MGRLNRAAKAVHAVADEVRKVPFGQPVLLEAVFAAGGS